MLGLETKILNNLRKEFPKGSISPSYLRVQKTLTNSSGSYSFNVKTESGQNAVEKKLDRNDLFVCTRVGIFLLDQVTAELGRSVLQSYPNKIGLASSASMDLNDLEAIYSGYFWLKSDQKVYVESLSMQEFRFVPQTQQSTTSNNTQLNMRNYCYQPPTPFYLWGTANLEIKVEFPTWSGIQIASTYSGHTMELVFHPFGFLVKNAR